MINQISLESLSQHIGAKLIKKKDITESLLLITGINLLEKACESEIAYIKNSKYLDKLQQTQAAAVILTEQYEKQCPTNSLIVEDSYLAFAKATQLFSYRPQIVGKNISEKAYIADSVKLPLNVCIEAGVSILNNAQIGDGSHIRSNAVIAENVVVGENCYIDCNVSILRDCILGKQCVIGAGSVIGSEGFGNAWDEKNQCWQSIIHQGRVILKDNVEIGANNAIDRGTIEDTIIEKGVRFDNLIMIAHNCYIGENSALAGQVGMAGNTIIGKNVKASGQVGFSGHLKITDNVTVMGKSLIAGNIIKSGSYAGYPAQNFKNWQKEIAGIRRLLKNKK